MKKLVSRKLQIMTSAAFLGFTVVSCQNQEVGVKVLDNFNPVTKVKPIEVAKSKATSQFDTFILNLKFYSNSTSSPNLDDFLKQLPPDFKRHFTFVYETGTTLQESSPEYPRAVVFDKDLVFTFNGHPSQIGFDTIEVLNFKQS